MFCELSVNINKKESRNFIKAFGKFYNVSRSSFKRVCIKMTTSFRFFLLHDFNVYRSTVEHVYLDFQTGVILDMCN